MNNILLTSFSPGESFFKPSFLPDEARYVRTGIDYRSAGDRSSDPQDRHFWSYLPTCPSQPQELQIILGMRGVDFFFLNMGAMKIYNI
jgi:hypothetical protein